MTDKTTTPSRAAMVLVLGILLVVLTVLGSAITAGGIFGTDYYRTHVTRITPDSERKPYSPLARVVVSDPRGHYCDVIVRRGDRKAYKPGDAVVICQPFGPPYIVPGVSGTLTLAFRLVRLPMIALGALLVAGGIAMSLNRRRMMETTEKGTEPESGHVRK